MSYLWATILGILYVAVQRMDYYGNEQIIRMSPDGKQYFAMGQGHTTIIPVGLRWLLPYVLKDRPLRWLVCSLVCMIALSPATLWYARTAGLSSEQGLFAAALVLGLVGVVRMTVVLPVLVDGPAMLLMVLSATCCNTRSLTSWHHYWFTTAGLSFISGCIRETAPVFTSLAARSPWPLLGLAAPAIRYMQIRNRKKCRAAPEAFSEVKLAAIRSNALAGMQLHKSHWFDPRLLVLPWGVCLLGIVFGGQDWWLWTSVALGYAQLLYAADTARMYQWAFPLVALKTAALVPRRWMIAAVLLHWYIPQPLVT